MSRVPGPAVSSSLSALAEVRALAERITLEERGPGGSFETAWSVQGPVGAEHGSQWEVSTRDGHGVWVARTQSGLVADLIALLPRLLALTEREPVACWACGGSGVIPADGAPFNCPACNPVTPPPAAQDRARAEEIVRACPHTEPLRGINNVIGKVAACTPCIAAALAQSRWAGER